MRIIFSFVIAISGLILSNALEKSSMRARGPIAVFDIQAVNNIYCKLY